jgi:hypothetical protein
MKKWLGVDYRVTTEKYREIFEGVFMDALIRGATQITYLPAWLAKTLQSHFDHHGETYYEEAKTIRENALLKGILSGKLQPGNPAPDPVTEMATAARLLKPAKRPAKKTPNSQLPLLSILLSSLVSHSPLLAPPSSVPSSRLVSVFSGVLASLGRFQNYAKTPSQTLLNGPLNPSKNFPNQFQFRSLPKFLPTPSPIPGSGS